jgi:hypothetical protein
MDRRKLRFGIYDDASRLTVRLVAEDRERLRRVAGAQQVTESDLVREAVTILLDTLEPSDESRITRSGQ